VRRERGHHFDLPRYKYDLTLKSFIMRALYEFVNCVLSFVSALIVFTAFACDDYSLWATITSILILCRL